MLKVFKIANYQKTQNILNFGLYSLWKKQNTSIKKYVIKDLAYLNDKLNKLQKKKERLNYLQDIFLKST